MTREFPADDIFFAPYLKGCKTPAGAAEQGCEVVFSLRLPYSFGCVKISLLVFDGDYGQTAVFPFEWEARRAGIETWTCRAVFPDCGVFFYRFSLSCPGGERSVGCGEHMAAAFTEALWQQTVYDPAFSTPKSARGGLYYQIFPDRFFGAADGECPFDDRVIVSDKTALPRYDNLDILGDKTKNNDYFGGDLEGIRQKLPYLSDLGVTALYLNPVFEAHSNHRYNTADYMKIDPLLGDERAFSRLCEEARKHGIAVILDGVFSHTGADSLYFNAEKRYGTGGAANSPDSPYFSWYRFSRWPSEYECWWNVESLPCVNELDPGFLEFITGENGVLAKWISLGASGWRLDVADELPDRFLEALRARVKAAGSENIIIGEVWENASNKISYGERRRFLLGGQLDTVMNYPVGDAVIDFVRGGSADPLCDLLNEVYLTYPKPSLHCLMNVCGTHDTPRLITRLAGADGSGRPREWQAQQQLSPAQKKLGIDMVMLASAIQYTIFGQPCLYYGDEVGMEGYGDPFNRRFFDWEKGDLRLLQHYKRLGQLRREVAVFADGEFSVSERRGGGFAFLRSREGENLLCAFNAAEAPYTPLLPSGFAVAENGVLLEHNTQAGDGDGPPAIMQYGFAVLRLACL